MKTLILLLLMFAAIGCNATVKQIEATATIATVQTVTAGIETFTLWAAGDGNNPGEEDRIAVDAVNACKGSTTRLAYVKCTNAITEPRRKPIDRAKRAIHIYRAVLAGGEKLAQDDLALSAQVVIEALAAVGIRVVAGGAL